MADAVRRARPEGCEARAIPAKTNHVILRNLDGDGEALLEAPTLKNLRQLSTFLPAHRVRYFRNLGQSPLARATRGFKVMVEKVEAGRALAEGRFDKLERLELHFGTTMGHPGAAATELLSSSAFSKVRELRLDHLGELEKTPLAATLEALVTAAVSDEVIELPRLKQLTVKVRAPLTQSDLRTVSAFKGELKLVPAGFVAGPHLLDAT